MKRRQFLVTTTLLPLAACRSSFLLHDFESVVGGRDIVESGIALDVTRIAETGNSVPVTVSVDSPMTAADHVRRIYIFVPGNPETHAATYHLSPACGRAEISTRIRLARTQTVRVVAEMSDDSVRATAVNVMVTLGACVEEMWTD